MVELTEQEQVRITTSVHAEHPLSCQCSDVYGTVEQIIDVRLTRLTSYVALAAFREAWLEADAEGAKGDRVRRGMAAAIEAVS